MMKLLILAGGGALAYMWWKNQQAQPQTGVSPYSAPNQAYANNLTLGGQPSQKYPYQAPVSPRVDTSNQPWYGGSRALAVPASATPYAPPQALQDVQTAAGMINSLTSIWDDLGVGDMFSSGGDGNQVADAGDGGFDWSSIMG